MESNDKILEEGLHQILAIAKERARLLDQLKQALSENDDQNIRRYASRICGIEDESDRIPARLDPGTKQ